MECSLEMGDNNAPQTRGDSVDVLAQTRILSYCTGVRPSAGDKHLACVPHLPGGPGPQYMARGY